MRIPEPKKNLSRPWKQHAMQFVDSSLFPVIPKKESPSFCEAGSMNAGKPLSWKGKIQEPLMLLLSTVRIPVKRCGWLVDEGFPYPPPPGGRQ